MKDLIHICVEHIVGVICNLRVVFMMRLPYRVLFSINLVVRSCFNLGFWSYIFTLAIGLACKVFKKLSFTNKNLKAQDAIHAGNGADGKCSWSPN